MFTEKVQLSGKTVLLKYRCATVKDLPDANKFFVYQCCLYKMGCVCCSLSSFVSILLDALERISLCTVCAMLTCCLLFTILTVMVLGIGIGYHYCFVQNSVEAMAKAAKAAGALRSGPGAGREGNVMRSVDKAMQRGFAHRLARREADTPVAANINSTNLLQTVGAMPPLNFTTFNVTNVTSI